MRHDDDEPDWLEHDDVDDDDNGMSDWDEDSDGGNVMCPKCGADMYEDAVKCPLCGEYVVHTHHVWQGKPIWWKLLGLAGVLALLGSLVMLM
jgi:predicted amidophosphoribosyltransferase